MLWIRSFSAIYRGGWNHCKRVRTMAEFTRCLGLLLVLLLCGCANLNSIFRSKPIDGARARLISIDAKQRVVLSNPASVQTGRDGQDSTVQRLRLCAEPPPDVFSAYAASLGAKASGSSTAEQRQIAAEFSASVSENAATIERSQTVNVLRESMYRTCERFLSGAISEEEFMIQAARDQRAMVQVLAVEQLTGAARAQATALTTVASSMTSGATDVGIAALRAAREDLDAKRAALNKIEGELAALEPKVACSALDPPPAGATAEQISAKKQKCQDAANAAKLQKESEAYLAVMQKAVATQGQASSTASGELTAQALNAVSVSTQIAEQVVRIVAINSAFNEVEMSCLALVRSNNILSPMQQSFVQACIRELPALIQTQKVREKNLFGEQAVFKQLGVILQEAETAASVIWKAMTTAGKVDPAKLTALIQASGQVIGSADRRNLSNATADSLADILTVLGVPVTQALLQAAQSGNP